MITLRQFINIYIVIIRSLNLNKFSIFHQVIHLKFVSIRYIVKRTNYIVRCSVDTRKLRKPDPVKPYDDSLWERWSMYDRMPYVWDPDLNVEKIFTKVSGNIIKSYRCQVKESIEVKHEWENCQSFKLHRPVQLFMFLYL